jgi:Spy/CpxP family protein refolding chaperone
MTQSTQSRFPKVRRVLARGANATRALVVVIAAGALLAPGISGASRGWGHRDPERVKQHVSMAADWLLYKVEASDDQKAKVQSILDQTLDDLQALHPDRDAMHEQIKSLLTAETIDRDAIERLRGEQLERFDLASRRISAAIADVAEVLTPAQRQELADLADSFHGHGWGH